MLKQISVFIENTKGSLCKLTGALGDAGVDLFALSVADTETFGIVRCITDDTQKGIDVLRSVGYTVKLTDVLGVEVPDRPGGLAGVLALLADAGISVDYLYSLFRSVNGYSLIIFRVDDNEKAMRIFGENGIRLIEHDEIARI